jgi:hypothetical protein
MLHACVKNISALAAPKASIPEAASLTIHYQNAMIKKLLL